MGASETRPSNILLRRTAQEYASRSTWQTVWMAGQAAWIPWSMPPMPEQMLMLLNRCMS